MIVDFEMNSIWIKVGPCLCSAAQLCWLFATPWAVACQAPLSIDFSRQQYWSGLPFPTPSKQLLNGQLENALRPDYQSWWKTFELGRTIMLCEQWEVTQQPCILIKIEFISFSFNINMRKKNHISCSILFKIKLQSILESPSSINNIFWGGRL